MPTDRKRIMISADPDLFRILGYEDTEELNAYAINGILSRYSRSIVEATRELDSILAREDWMLLADVLNGCADLWDMADSRISPKMLIMAEVEDGHRLNGLGEKWYGDDGDRNVRQLVRKIRAMTPSQADAVMAAVRYFWADTNRDAGEDWWRIEERLPRTRSLSRD